MEYYIPYIYIQLAVILSFPIISFSHYFPHFTNILSVGGRHAVFAGYRDVVQWDLACSTGDHPGVQKMRSPRHPARFTNHGVHRIPHPNHLNQVGMFGEGEAR